MFLGRTIGVFIFAVMLIAGLSSCGGPVEVKPTPDIAVPTDTKFGGRVEPTGVNVDLRGVDVTVGDVKVKTDSKGNFALPELQAGKTYVLAEKRFASGSVKRVLGMGIYYVSDAPIRINLKLKDATDLDAYCLDCHPKGKATRKDQRLRCAHLSGVIPKKAVGWREKRNEDGLMTCESCHTLHQASPFPHFQTESMEKSLMCRRCHVE